MMMNHNLFFTDCRRLFIRDFELIIPLGVHDFEKQAPQRLQVDIDVYIPLKFCTPSQDNLTEVFDYDWVHSILRSYNTSLHTHLQETVCDWIAQRILAHPHVRAVRVQTQKPDVYTDCAAVGIEIFHLKEV